MINGTIDRITVKDYFKNDSTLNVIERIRFQDGTGWMESDIAARVYFPTSD
jgi:hypothetical protein